MKSYELGSPIRTNLEITESCPLACRHCYTYWGYAATGNKVLPTDENYSYEHFLGILDKLASLGVRMLTITGGEPFNKKSLLFPLISAARARNMIVFVNTSASLLDKSDAGAIKNSGANGFLVSLMSCNEDIHNHLAQADSFDNTVSGIKILVETGQNVSINMVCSKENCGDVRDTAKFVESLGVRSFSAAPMMAALSYPGYLAMRLDHTELRNVIEDLLWVRENTNLITTTLESLPYCAFEKDDLIRYRDILSHSYCGAGMVDIAISSAGDVRPCIMSGESVGNILNDDWNDLWERMSLWRTDSMLPSECLKCVVVAECGGGCRVSANNISGHADGRDPYMKDRIDVVPWSSGGFLDDHNGNEIRLDFNLRISEDAVDRPEPFGGTVFIGSRAVFLKEDSYKLYLRLKAMTYFVIDDIRHEFEIKIDDLKRFIQILTDEGIVEMT